MEMDENGDPYQMEIDENGSYQNCVETVVSDDEEYLVSCFNAINKYSSLSLHLCVKRVGDW